VDCLEQALQIDGTSEIFNTDQGCQFTSEAFTGVLKAHGLASAWTGAGGHWIMCLWNGSGVASNTKACI
jgi:putative transposase